MDLELRVLDVLLLEVPQPEDVELNVEGALVAGVDVIPVKE